MITTDHLMIDRRILQEAESLRDAGHEVEILAGFECQKPEEYYWRGIRISRFVFDWFDPRAQKLLGLVKYRDNRFWPRLWRTTCKALALLTGITSFEHFVLRQILERQFDVLHVHDYPLLHVGVEVKKRRGCTLVYDAHELYHGQAQLPAATRRRYRRREKRLIREVDAAFTVNPYIAGIMARDYGCPQPHVLLNAAPLVSSTGTTATLRAKLGLSSQARIVLYQGWMSPERGIEALVRAASLFLPAFIWS
ncbi:glycosyltransferase [Bradyrhizobium sp. 13971]